MDSSDVRREWAERSGEFSPTYYAHHGPNETSEVVASVLAESVGRDASVLELGCSAGRHLSYLHEQGFTDLSGVEINDDAMGVMAEAFPELAEAGTFYVDAIEAVVPEFEDDRFDAVYSVETLQHIHPDDADVFAEVARVASDRLVVAESDPSDADESDAEAGAFGAYADGDGAGGRTVTFVRGEVPLYYRDWTALFGDYGFVQADARPGQRNTVRSFRPA